jgi:hypothetical protein
MENNENTLSESQIYYNYPIKNFLVKEIDTDNHSEIILCVYTINTSGRYPFIQYLLSNNMFYNLSLPVLPTFSSFSKNNLTSYSKVFLSGILKVDNFEEFNREIEFDGFYEYEEKVYLFFDVTKCELGVDDTYSSSPIRFALIDEIINRSYVCDTMISSETVNFFINNNSINYLYDAKNEAYEHPIVGFVGKQTPEKMNFVLTFGESAKDKLAILGAYYYFTDFKHAIRQGGWSNNYRPEHLYNKLVTDNENGRYAKGGIVRFALFTGKTKYIENNPNNPVDESEIKKQRLNDNFLNQNYEVQTLRISDHDGIWATTYDSAYLGNIELDDGSFIDEIPMIVLKEYKQQIPLSCHYIDKSKLTDRFESNSNNYGIV